MQTVRSMSVQASTRPAPRFQVARPSYQIGSLAPVRITRRRPGSCAPMRPPSGCPQLPRPLQSMRQQPHFGRPPATRQVMRAPIPFFGGAAGPLLLGLQLLASFYFQRQQQLAQQRRMAVPRPQDGEELRQRRRQYELQRNGSPSGAPSTGGTGAPRSLGKSNASRRAGVNMFNVRSEANYTLMKVQVGLFGDIKKFQRTFNKLAGLYDADDEDSLFKIMEEAVEVLLRNIEYAGYGSTAGKAFEEIEDCEAKFQQVSLDERTKYKEETLVNSGSRKRSRTFSGEGVADHGLDQWMCVTLLVAVDGPARLPKKIESVADMRKALTTLAGVGPDELLAFELIWTPQDDGDSYSKDELLADYPAMSNL